MHSLADLIRRIEELERRVANILRPARVTAVDPVAGRVRVDAGGLASPWLPWTETAGAIRSWSPPSPGQQVLLVSPSGEPGQGWVMAGGFSTAVPAPSGDGAAQVLTLGQVRTAMTPDSYSLTVGPTRLEVTPGGMRWRAPRFDFEQG